MKICIYINITFKHLALQLKGTIERNLWNIILAGSYFAVHMFSNFEGRNDVEDCDPFAGASSAVAICLKNTFLKEENEM